jgi:hypothetical protein
VKQNQTRGSTTQAPSKWGVVGACHAGISFALGHWLGPTLHLLTESGHAVSYKA